MKYLEQVSEKVIAVYGGARSKFPKNYSQQISGVLFESSFWSGTRTETVLDSENS